MVRGEIEIARHHAAINVGARGFCRCAWRSTDRCRTRSTPTWTRFSTPSGPDAADTPRLLRELLDVVGGDAPRSAGAAARPRPPAAHLPPPYAAPLPVPGGTLDVDDPWYLPRPTDATALSLIRQPGQTLTIKGPRQMGKSSLLMRTVKAGMDAGKTRRAARLSARR